METRKAKGLEGGANIDDIYTALTKGGFKFETSGEDNSKRAIKISLAKNTAQFSKVGDDLFGLKKWYGGAGSRPRKANGGTSTADEEEPTADDTAPVTPEKETAEPELPVNEK